MFMSVNVIDCQCFCQCLCLRTSMLLSMFVSEIIYLLANVCIRDHVCFCPFLFLHLFIFSSVLNVAEDLVTADH